jgi:hypothetical protein
MAIQEASPAVLALFQHSSYPTAIYMYVTSKNFISNYQHLITDFIDPKLYILGMLYILHYMCIVACEGSDIKPEVPL